jgi:ABC-type Mn2+/Zn2+ transport system permease subunit
MIPAHWTSRNTYYIGLYAILLSLAYGIISLVPGLEGHMTATYFGDIATASHYEAGFMILMGMLGLLFFLFYWKKITAYSFNLSLFGFSINSHDTHNYNHLFIFLSQLTIAASVLFLGLLFTLLCLFLPILILVRFQQGFKSLAVKLILSAALGVGTGIIFSLWQGTLPTVSCIALGIVICSFGTAVKNTHH